MSHFRFLDLPPELRNQVYKILLTNTSTVQRIRANCASCINNYPDIQNTPGKYCTTHLQGFTRSDDSTNTITGPLIPSRCLIKFTEWEDRDTADIRRPGDISSDIPRHINQSILCASRQCHLEGVGLLYSLNRFAIPIEPLQPHNRFPGPGSPYLSIFPDIAFSHLQDVRVEMQLHLHYGLSENGQLEYQANTKWRDIASKAAQMTNLKVLQVSVVAECVYAYQGQWEMLGEEWGQEYQRGPMMALLRALSDKLIVWGLREGDLGYPDESPYYKGEPIEMTVLTLLKEIEAEKKKGAGGEDANGDTVENVNKKEDP